MWKSYQAMNKYHKIVIVGLTADGQPFRPSDWAERMCGGIATFNKNRILYSPLLTPTVKNGNQCIVVDTALDEKNHALFTDIMNFARQNKLTICDEKDIPPKSPTT